jgi:hypothetical protein
MLAIAYHCGMKLTVSKEARIPNKKGSWMQAALGGPRNGLLDAGPWWVRRYIGVDRSTDQCALCPAAGLWAGAAGFFFSDKRIPSRSTI